MYFLHTCFNVHQYRFGKSWMFCLCFVLDNSKSPSSFSVSELTPVWSQQCTAPQYKREEKRSGTSPLNCTWAPPCSRNNRDSCTHWLVPGSRGFCSSESGNCNWYRKHTIFFLNVCCVLVFYVFVLFCVLVFLYGPFCQGVIDISTLFTTFFLWTSLQFIL